jgi:hypothetical protein
LAEALETEILIFLSQYSKLKNDPERGRITCNGYLPENEIQTDIGPITVKVPRGVWDRQPDGIGSINLHQPYCFVSEQDYTFKLIIKIEMFFSQGKFSNNLPHNFFHFSFLSEFLTDLPPH